MEVMNIRFCVHIVPVHDTRLHTYDEHCFCYPFMDMTAKFRMPVWIHNAEDCREARERTTGAVSGKGWAIITIDRLKTV